jgi:hypothetical protein
MEKIALAAVEDNEYKHSDYSGMAMRRAKIEAVNALDEYFSNTVNLNRRVTK